VPEGGKTPTPLPLCAPGIVPKKKYTVSTDSRQGKEEGRSSSSTRTAHVVRWHSATCRRRRPNGRAHGVLGRLGSVREHRLQASAQTAYRVTNQADVCGQHTVTRTEEV
jgi:hypothetical protein